MDYPPRTECPVLGYAVDAYVRTFTQAQSAALSSADSLDFIRKLIEAQRARRNNRQPTSPERSDYRGPERTSPRRLFRGAGPGQGAGVTLCLCWWRQW
jgi:hypothetical protein